MPGSDEPINPDSLVSIRSREADFFMDQTSHSTDRGLSLLNTAKTSFFLNVGWCFVVRCPDGKLRRLGQMKTSPVQAVRGTRLVLLPHSNMSLATS